MSLKDDIKQRAFELGFDLVGITDTSAIDNEQVKMLIGWLKAGYAGEMSYMHRNLEKRINPGKLLENAKSVICVGLNYKPPEQKLKSSDSAAAMGNVASYAQYEDYHSFIKKRLRKLAEFISSHAGTKFKFKICVDSAPLAERVLAGRAGLGFIGKNHMLINPQMGLQILLGEIITTLKLQPDVPSTNNCSNCNKCIAACPTGALRPDGQFDANRCISYLTIEYKEQIPPDLAEKIGDWLFGCEECILACPYQKDAPVCKNKQFKFYGSRNKVNLQRILNLTQQEFDAELAGPAIKRLGLDRLKRNARICLENITNISGGY